MLGMILTDGSMSVKRLKNSLLLFRLFLVTVVEFGTLVPVVMAVLVLHARTTFLCMDKGGEENQAYNKRELCDE
jgi:hypothetical protein